MENINEDNINDDNNNEISDTDDVTTDDVTTDDLDSAVADDTAEFTVDDDMVDPVVGDATVGPAPPPQAPIGETRLTRDPMSTFGGVLSGIAHRYGWDVSLTRIAFIIALVASFGTALIVYLLAWVIIPRAQFWPPVPRPAGQISGRDLGLGLLGLGTLVAIAIGSGTAASVIVPAALVAGGIYLLVQNPRAVPTPAMSGVPAGHGGGIQQPAYAAMPTVAPQPAPPRSRLGRGVLFAVIAGVILIPVLLIGGAIALVSLATSDSVDWEFDGDTISHVPMQISEIPSTIDISEGEVLVDLSNIDFSDIDTVAERIDLDIHVEAGKVEVILPDDVRVNVDAEADFLGAVDMFGNDEGGISPDLSFTSDNPQLDLDIQVEIGKIEVSRVASSS